MISSVSIPPPRALRFLAIFIFLATLYIHSRGITWSQPSRTTPPVPQETGISDSLASELATIPDMAYDITARPLLHGLTNLLQDLPKHLVPKAVTSAPGAGKHGQRIVIVGDVHGQLKALNALLDKVGFDRSSTGGSDHLVLVGDMINRGPDSAGVVQLAMDLGASAVRGNHEDTVLLFHEWMQRAAADGGNNGKPRQPEKKVGKDGKETLVYAVDHVKATLAPVKHDIRDDHEEDEGHKEKKKEEKKDKDKRAALRDKSDDEEVNADKLKGWEISKQTALSLSPAQIAWLRSLPVILNIGPVPRQATTSSSSSSWFSSPKPHSDDIKDSKEDDDTTQQPIANLVVVHGGLVPSVPLAQQDPWAVMTMRSLVYPIDTLRRNVVKNHLQKAARSRKPKNFIASTTTTTAAAAVEGAKGKGNAAAAAAVAAPPVGYGNPLYRQVTEKDVDNELARVIAVQKVMLAEEMNAQAEMEYAAAAAAGTGSSSSGDHMSGKTTSSTAQAPPVVVRPEDVIEVKVPIPVDTHEGELWTLAWNRAQQRVREEKDRVTVVFGHDAKTGLNLRGQYTYGLDSGCGMGNQLTALVLEAVPGGGVKREIVQVECDAIHLP